MNNPRRKVAFHTLGCKLNFAETSTISRSFPSDKFERVAAKAKADIYVINTCSVTEAADKKCRQAIRRFISQSPDAFIAVVGCYAQLKAEEISLIPGVDLVLGTNEKFDIAGYLEAAGKKEKTEIHSSQMPSPGVFNAAFSMGDRTRSFLKVQDGCDYRCSYCTIPVARGRSRNQEINFLREEAEKIAGEGIKEIVLTGVNIGDFGKSTGDTFADLLRELVKVSGIERYRISSIEPDLITDEIIDLTASGEKILPHFHIPLQSGSDKILGLMKRRYNRDLFANRIRRIREALPLAGIGADIIAGFPGESDADFNDTVSFLTDMPLSYLHVFNFSERPGTAAVNMAGKIPDTIREKRSKRLLSLSEEKHLAFCKMNIGQVSKVLFERTRKNNMMSGFTGNYLKTDHPWDASLCGEIKSARLVDLYQNGNLKVELLD
jgi:threonylcarbamoyladenosine tRNA methylthiotransferase MtaB